MQVGTNLQCPLGDQLSVGARLSGIYLAMHLSTVHKFLAGHGRVPTIESDPLDLGHSLDRACELCSSWRAAPEHTQVAWKGACVSASCVMCPCVVHAVHVAGMPWGC